MERDIEREENPLLKYVREIDKLSNTTEEEKKMREIFKNWITKQQRVNYKISNLEKVKLWKMGKSAARTQ